ncbi:MAG: hypothetical protein WAZ40_00220 [Minisyncoccia bacterium]
MNKPIISFAVFLLSLAFSFFYVLPAYNLNVERRENVANLDDIFKNSKEIGELIKKTKNSLNTVDDAELERFKIFLPASIDPIRFANNIQEIGRKNRIILSNISVQSDKKEIKMNTPTEGGVAQGLTNALSMDAKITQVEAVTVTAIEAPSDKKFVSTKASISFTTDYLTFQGFLKELERSLALINITSLTFSEGAETSGDSKKSKTPSAPLYQYSMDIETYSIK